jgi:hypothetical protein
MQNKKKDLFFLSQGMSGGIMLRNWVQRRNSVYFIRFLGTEICAQEALPMMPAA